MKKELKSILLNHLTTLSKIVVGLVICILISSQSGYAQEVDKNKSNKKKLRETRFKTRNKQGDRIHKGDITGRKKKTKRTKKKSKITSPSPSPYGNALYKNKDRRKEGKNVQQSGGYFNTPSRPTENHRKGDISGRKTRKSVTRTGEGKSVQPSANPYAGQKNRTEGQKAKTSRAQGGGFQSITQGGEDKRRKRKRIQPRTASRAFIARKKVNAYAGKARRGERAKTKDIAGRKIRSKNFRSRTQPIIRPSFNPYFARKSKGDRAHPTIKGTGYTSSSKKGERKYKGQAAGGYSTASKKGENAWLKDITGRDFKRPRDPGVVIGKKGQAYTGNQKRTLSISGGLKNNERRSINSSGGGGTVSSRMRKGKGKVLPRRDLSNPQVGGFAGRYKMFELSPGFENSSSKFQGNAKGSRRAFKGGGSVSNNIWKGKGKAMPRKDLGSPQIGGFAGRYKRFEMSPGFQKSSSKFQGNVKGGRKPLKGGGSISNNIWQGKGKAIPRKDLGKPQISGFAGRYKRFEMSPGFQKSSSKFQGNVKGSRKPLKGGGSISKNIWKGRGKAMPRKDLGSSQISGFAGRYKRFEMSPGFQTSSSKFQGNVKGGRKPLKGGGSITNNIWQGRGNTMPRKDLGNSQISGFAGRYKRFEMSPGFQKSSSKFQGNVKGSRKPLKGGGSISKNIWQGKGKAMPRKDLGNSQISGFVGRFKRFEIAPGFQNSSSKFQGNIKGNRKPLKGGGSITKTGWNNNQQPLQKNDRFQNNMTLSQGNFKGNRKPLKGGGSITKSGWNNNQQPLQKNDKFQNNMALSQGNIKGSRKPLKGGGSITKTGWNNNQQPLQKNDRFQNNMTLSQGNIKGSRKSLKGGGSITKTGWNNNQQPLQKNDRFQNNMTFFQGNVKGYRKPLKGGGSISRSGWNNDRTPLPKKPLTFQNLYTSKFKGRFDRFEISPGFLAEDASQHRGNFKRTKNYDRNMHPSAKYTTSLHPKNSLEEKRKIFKFNIWWAKLFRKNDNQPTAVKEKKRNPRYDKREKDLWYD